LGLVQYLAGDAKRVPAVGVSVFTDAPGLLPPDNTISPVLLVTHQRLGESEAQEVRTVVSNTQRQYFVAYFPATPEDNSEEAVRNLREAFRVPEDLGASNPNANQLRIFAPEPGTPAGGYGTYFVESALNPDDLEYVVNRAIRGLFVDQGLLRAELKF